MALPQIQSKRRGVGGSSPIDPGDTLLLADGSSGSLFLADGTSYLLLAT
jgi:hypothetical protein